jgi:hypothetical protein
MRMQRSRTCGQREQDQQEAPHRDLHANRPSRAQVSARPRRVAQASPAHRKQQLRRDCSIHCAIGRPFGAVSKYPGSDETMRELRTGADVV